MSYFTTATETVPVMPFAYDNNNNDGFGNNGAWWIIILFLFAMRGGWGMNNNGPAPDYMTRTDADYSNLASATRSLQQSVSDGFHGVDNAVCTLGYQNAQLINGVQMQVANEFRGIDNAICTLGYQTQQGFNQTGLATLQAQNALATQLAECCCNTQSAIKDNAIQSMMNTNAITNAINDSACAAEKTAMQSRFDAAQYNCATLQAIDNMGDKILCYLNNREEQRLRDENATLKLTASQQAQNAYLISQLKTSTTTTT